MPDANTMGTVSGTTAARLNSIDQVQARLNVGRSTVFELIRSGQLRSTTIGRRRLVSDLAIAEFITRLEEAAS